MTPAGLVSLLFLHANFWVFCTEKHLSMCQFHQFYNMTKISIEILSSFVYNVCIVVHSTQVQQAEGFASPKGVFHHVFC